MDVDSSSQWVVLLPELIAGVELPEAIYIEKERSLIGAIRAANEAILQLLIPLGSYLTTESDAPRSRAVALLAKIIEEIPESIRTPNDLHHLTEFFTARLNDWPAIRGALLGCCSLLQKSSSQDLQLTVPDAVAILDALAKRVYVRSLSAKDRAVALSILHAGIIYHGQALLDADIDLLEFTIASVDGEKDPRCLLEAFAAVRALLMLYQQQPEDSLHYGRLKDSADELFDVLSCYFPVSFTPPPNDPHGITREDIAARLEDTLVAYPGFAPHVVPLALDKLASSIKQAKLDSLHLLGAAAASFGPDPLEKDLSAIWTALRGELLAPANESLLEAELSSLEAMASAAAHTLSQCARSFESMGGNLSLPSLVLEESVVGDLLQLAGAPGVDATTFKRSMVCAKATCTMLAALGEAGGMAAQHMADSVLSNLVELAEEQQTKIKTSTAASVEVLLLPSMELTWASIACLVQSLGKGIVADISHAVSIDTDLLIDRIVAISSNLPATIVPPAAARTAAGTADEILSSSTDTNNLIDTNGTSSEVEVCNLWNLDRTACSLDTLAWKHLLTLESVFGSESLAAGVSEGDATVVACVLVEGIASQKSIVRSQAINALCAMASGLHASVVARSVLPKLFESISVVPHPLIGSKIEYKKTVDDGAGVSPSSAPLVVPRVHALAALEALCSLKEKESMLQETIIALDQAVQTNLPHCIEHAADSELAQEQTRLVEDVLASLIRVILGWEASSSGASSGADQAPVDLNVPEMLVQLAHHLLDAALLLQKGSAEAKESSIVTSSAAVAFHATRLGTSASQKKLGNAAAQALIGILESSIDKGTSVVEINASTLLQVAVCCGILVGLQQEASRCVLTDQPARFLEMVIELALKSSTPPAAWPYLAKASASFFNKNTTDCEEKLIKELLHHATCSDSCVNPGAWAMLPEISRGLAMKGSPHVELLVSTVAHRLSSSTSNPPNSPLEDSKSIKHNAACFFSTLLLDESDYPAHSIVLGRKSHAVVRMLWQQRTYTLAASALGSALYETSQGRDGSNPKNSAILLLALGYLLAGAPAAVRRSDAQRTVPWLARCLSELPQEENEGNTSGEYAGLLRSLLVAIADALESELGKKEAQGSLVCLVPALASLTSYRPSAGVREAAVQGLEALLKLPYAAVHPHRREVLKAVSSATDDDRRSVRAAAARCRQAWLAT